MTTASPSTQARAADATPVAQSANAAIATIERAAFDPDRLPDHPPTPSFGEVMRRLRVDRGLRQSDVADACQVQQAFVSGVEIRGLGTRRGASGVDRLIAHYDAARSLTVQERGTLVEARKRLMQGATDLACEVRTNRRVRGPQVQRTAAAGSAREAEMLVEQAAAFPFESAPAARGEYDEMRSSDRLHGVMRSVAGRLVTSEIEVGRALVEAGFCESAARAHALCRARRLNPAQAHFMVSMYQLMVREGGRLLKPAAPVGVEDAA